MLKVDVVLGFGGFGGWVVSGGEEAGLAFFFQSIALAFDVEDGGAVQQAVEGGASHDRIAGEDVRPFGEGFIGGDDGGGVLFVAMADDLEEHGGAGLIEAEIADFVDDEQPGLGEHFQARADGRNPRPAGACEARRLSLSRLCLCAL